MICSSYIPKLIGLLRKLGALDIDMKRRYGVIDIVKILEICPLPVIYSARENPSG
jgi:hypothetical protein